MLKIVLIILTAAAVPIILMGLLLMAGLVMEEIRTARERPTMKNVLTAIVGAVVLTGLVIVILLVVMVR